MIKHLRLKFIVSNMLLVSLVLLAVFSIQTFSTYRHAQDQIYQAQSVALRWVTQDSPLRFEFGRPHQDRDSRPNNNNFPSVPIFAVEINEAGQVFAPRAGPSTAVTQETAQELVNAALALAQEQGSLPGENLSFLFREENGRRFCAFADNRILSRTLRTQLLTSLLIGILALSGFFLISRFLAKLSLRPVEQIWDQQRQFVADASHELRTPITVILANAGILQAHPDEPVRNQKKWIDYIQDEATQMKGLVDDLLFLAKSDSAQLPAHPLPVRLDQVATGALLPFESIAFETGVSLLEDISPHITVLGDEAQLHRLVVILLDNAVKYAGPSGQVTLRLRQVQDRPWLSVHNTGSVIPPEHLPHLFERFYRADAARDRSQGGYGLGLSIAKSIVEGHGGTVSVSSSSGEGTTFTVVFPKK